MAALTPDDLAEIFADSGSEDEFEGFTLDDLEANNIRQANDGLLIEDWTEGDRNRPNLVFTATPGLTDMADLPDQPEPIDYFGLFFKQADFETIAHETNRYADSFMERNGATLKPCSRFKKWTDATKTTWQEMKVFLAMLIAMGLTTQLAFSEYWTTDEVTETPFYRKLMSRDRAYLLMSFFHLANNAEYIQRRQPGHDPLHKLGDLYKILIARFAAMIIPSQHLSLDEGMIPWRGHLSFRVYNPDKPHKYGIKAYMVCDSVTGYCIKFKLYTGKSDIPVSRYGATYDLVFNMMQGYMDQGYILYMDNYYSGLQLYWDLWICGIGATGTLRSNRQGIPQMIKDAPCKEKGSTFSAHNKHMLIMKYHDRKVVHMITTTEKAAFMDTDKLDPRTQQVVRKPEVVVKYDKNMGGVDHSDQMVSYATFSCRTLKWWKRVIFHVISLATLNAYIIYKQRVGERNAMLPRTFRKQLVKALILSVDPDTVPAWTMRKASGRPVLRNDRNTVQRLQGRHFLEKIVGEGKKSNITRACVVCEHAERKKFQRENPGQKRKRCGRESSYQCDTCKLSLCVAPCFKIYHTYTNFEQKYMEMTYAPAPQVSTEEDSGEDSDN